MKAAPLAAILMIALAATGAVAQTTTEATPAQSAPAEASPPKILNAPKPAVNPATVEPYAGQKPPSTATATPAPAAPSATATAATAPAAEGAATAAKAAASEAKSAPSVPEGPAVKPIAKSGETPAAAKAGGKSDAKTEAKAETKPEAVPTLAKPEPPKPTLRVAIDLTSQKMSVTEDGGATYKWNISSGRTGYLTPKGTFRPVWMSKMWYSRKYDYAPMPHAIFFHGGAAIHGTDSVYALGRPASHGCVRLSPGNAATLFRLVTKHGKQKTQITVFGTPKQGPAVASGEEPEGRRIRTTTRSYEDLPGWNDDDDDGPPVPSRGVYSDRGDDEFDRPYRPSPRQRRYVREYDRYGDDF